MLKCHGVTAGPSQLVQVLAALTVLACLAPVLHYAVFVGCDRLHTATKCRRVVAHLCLALEVAVVLAFGATLSLVCARCLSLPFFFWRGWLHSSMCGVEGGVPPRWCGCACTVMRTWLPTLQWVGCTDQ